jgi:hypothetical protein
VARKGESGQIAAEVNSVMSDRLSEWKNDAIIGPHLPFVRKAFEHFSTGDFLSASSILYPRIEGLIRISAASKSNRTVSGKNFFQSLGQEQAARYCASRVCYCRNDSSSILQMFTSLILNRTRFSRLYLVILYRTAS